MLGVRYGVRLGTVGTYVRYGWTLPDLLGVEVKMGLLGRSSTEWLGNKFEKKMMSG